MNVTRPRSSRTVFRDLGFSPEEAEHLTIRSVLMMSVQHIIRSRRLKQAEAARLLGVPQPRVSDLLRVRVDLFSTDTPIDMLAHLWGHAKLGVKPPDTPTSLVRVRSFCHN